RVDEHEWQDDLATNGKAPFVQIIYVARTDVIYRPEPAHALLAQMAIAQRNFRDIDDRGVTHRTMSGFAYAHRDVGILPVHSCDKTADLAHTFGPISGKHARYTHNAVR